MSTEDKQLTAVEYFFNEVDILFPFVSDEKAKQFCDIYAKALEMENKQKIDSFNRGFKASCEIISVVK